MVYRNIYLIAIFVWFTGRYSIEQGFNQRMYTKETNQLSKIPTFRPTSFLKLYKNG